MDFELALEKVQVPQAQAVIIEFGVEFEAETLAPLKVEAILEAEEYVGVKVASIRAAVIVEFEGAGTGAFNLAAVDKGQGFDTGLSAYRFPSLGGHAIRAPSCSSQSSNESKTPCSYLDSERLIVQRGLQRMLYSREIAS